MQNTNMEIMKNWLYDHCGTLQIPSCVCKIAHSEACGIIAFVITLLLFLAYFLFCYRAVVWSYYLVSMLNRLSWVSAPFSPHFFLYENENTRKCKFHFGEHLKLETKSIFILNIFSNIILHTIDMEVGYILCSYTLNFLFIRSEVYVFVYVNYIDPFFFF